MSFWIVSHRAPLARGAKHVRVWRTAVVAESEEKAIEVAQGSLPDRSTPEGEEFHREFIDGTWSDDLIETSKIALTSRLDEPTAAERAARDERVQKADARVRARR
jgi:hypothetical protein